MSNLNESQRKIVELAQSLTYSEWIRVRAAVDCAFEDKACLMKRDLKPDTERIEYYLNR